MNCLIRDLYGCSACSNPGELWGRKKTVVCQSRVEGWTSTPLHPESLGKSGPPAAQQTRHNSWHQKGWFHEKDADFLQLDEHNSSMDHTKEKEAVVSSWFFNNLEHLYKRSHEVNGHKSTIKSEDIFWLLFLNLFSFVDIAVLLFVIFLSWDEAQHRIFGIPLRLFTWSMWMNWFWRWQTSLL